MKKLLFIGVLAVLPACAEAQTAQVIAVCGTLPTAYTVGTVRNLTMDTNGRLCVGTAAAPLALSADGSLQLAAPKPKAKGQHQ